MFQNPPSIDSTSLYTQQYLSLSFPNRALTSSVVLLLATTTLLAMGVKVMHNRASSKSCPPVSPVTSPSVSSDVQIREPDPLTTLASRAKQVLLDFQELERRIISEKVQPKQLRLFIPTQERQICRRDAGILSSAPSAKVVILPSGRYTQIAAEAIHSGQLSSAFTAFCERLLLTNRIWRQQKQIKDLQEEVIEVQRAKCSNAFLAFCDRLLLSNAVWKLEKQVNSLAAEGEKLKKSRVAAVTRAGKRMVMEVRKDRLIDEYVKDLILEVQEGERRAERLKADHEREIQEITGEWSKDYRKLFAEMQRLRLANDARLVEQEISNEMEESLYSQISSLKRKADRLEEVTLTARTPSKDSGSVFFSSQSDDADEDLSAMTDFSSSTCVSVGDSGRAGTSKPARTSNFYKAWRRSDLRVLSMRRANRANYRGVRRTPYPRKLDTGSFAGFSFNPLFFGRAESSSADYDEHVSNKSKPISLRLPVSSGGKVSIYGSAANSYSPHSPKQAKTLRWRV